MPTLMDTPESLIRNSPPASSAETAPSPPMDDSVPPAPTPPARHTPAAQPAKAADDDDGFVPDAVPPIYVRPEDIVVPIRQTTLAYANARSILSRFESSAAELTGVFREKRAQADSLRLDMNRFADDLESLATRWRDLVDPLLNTREARDPALIGFRGSLLAVTTYQDAFLTAYAAAVRNRDEDAAVRAFNDLTRADEMLERARAYLR
jgi:hypothetical protein